LRRNDLEIRFSENAFKLAQYKRMGRENTNA
jgi:hypothetical protein